MKTVKWAQYAKYHITPMMFENANTKVPPHIKRPEWMSTNIKNPKFSSDTYQIMQSNEEIIKIKNAAKQAKIALQKAVELSKTETNGHDLDVKLTQHIIDSNCYPSGIGYMGFPKSICISPNDVLVHGVPNKYEFKNGDSMNLDVTVFVDGYFGDNSTMVTIGDVDPQVQKLVR